VSHDTDKLIRQLSLVAFLMAERRPLTARDIKQTVEGYSEMSDEAFARRFYSDRAELIALGVPLDSQRDEFTGEELYTLRPEEYFLPQLELSDEEFAALQTCLYLLEGRFAYAEPLRLALQNLALGRPGLEGPPVETAVRVDVVDPDYSPDMPAFIADYVAANPTRNRPLDLLPLLALNDPGLTKRPPLQGQKVKARPAFHYRLPNSLIDDPDWSVAREWDQWLLVERLAGDPGLVRRLSRTYLDWDSTLVGYLSDSWVKQLDAEWVPKLCEPPA
jgi:hypothetical protein